MLIVFKRLINFIQNYQLLDNYLILFKIFSREDT